MKTKRIIGVALLTAGLVMGSVGATSADETPAPTVTKSATAYGAELTAYREAIVQYRVTLVTSSIAYRVTLQKYWADWQATVAKYEASWKAELEKYQALHAAYLAKLAPINSARNAALDRADAEFLAAIASAKNTASQELALKVHATATAEANAIYKAAVAALGDAPVRPTKPAELTRPPLPAKPTPPVKPVAPVNPAVTKKK